MEPEQKLNASRRYAVFLSYRHADNKEAGRQWATWLHHLLEGYEIPADLVGKKNSKGDSIPASLYPVFRDEEELPADADLTRNIRQALENSELLVVLCSPRAVESRFVADEIRYFKELGKSNRILALMIDGEPNASDDPGKAKLGINPEAECLPEPLRYGVAGDDGQINWSQRTEPIAADVRPDGNAEQGWTTGAAYREALQKNGKFRVKEIVQKVHAYEQQLELAKLKVVAGSLGVPLGELTRRDKAMQLDKARKRARTLKLWLAAVGVLALLAAAGGIFSWFQRSEALKTASTTDFAIADLKLEKEEWAASLAYLADALRNNPKNRNAMVLAVSLIRSLPLPLAVMRHDGGVLFANFSPDGKWVVTAADDDTARIWDAQTGKPVGQPMKHSDRITSASFSPDSKWVVTSSWDTTARIWNAQTGLPAGKPIEHPTDAVITIKEPIYSANFSPDGKLVVTASGDETARVWDLQTGQPVGKPMGHGDDVYSAKFSPDGKWVLTTSKDGSARVWNTQTGQPVSPSIRQFGISASFSPDGKWVLTTEDDKTARIWDAQTGQPVGQPMKHDAQVESASFSPDGKWVVTTSADNTARVWDVQTGQSVGQPMKHDAQVESASFSPDGKWVVTASDDDTARIWEAQTGKQVGQPMKHNGGVNSAKFSPDGKWVVTASDDDTARTWDVPTTQPVGQPMKQGKWIEAANFSPDGKWVVTASRDDTAQVWDAKTGQPVGRPMNHAGRFATFSRDGKLVMTEGETDIIGVWDALTGQPVGNPIYIKERFISAGFSPFSPDGKWVVTAYDDNAAQIWNLQTGQRVGQMLEHAGEDGYETVNSASFSPDGKWVVTAADDESARIWDARTGQPIGLPMKHNAQVETARFSPDSKWVVTASKDKTARVWDAQTGQPVSLPMKHNGNVWSAMFSFDGRLVVTASDDGTARIWDARTGQPVGLPMEHDQSVTSASFSPDDKWIVTTSGGDTVRIWDAHTGQLMGQPMRHDGSASTAEFSPDSKWVVTASPNGVGVEWFYPGSKWLVSTSEQKIARLWDVVIADRQAPLWLSELAETVGGEHLNSQGVLEPSLHDPAQLRHKLQTLPGKDDLSRFGCWIATIPSMRTISPLSSITVPEFVSQRLQENTYDSLEEAYDIDPGDPLIVASLAKFERDKDRALFLCRYALQRAKIEYPPEKIEQVRSIAKSLFPDLPEFNDTTSVLRFYRSRI